MSKYTDWQERDAKLHAFHDREDSEHAAFCGGCGRRLSDHLGPEGTCRRLQDLLQLIIDWHLGGDQALARLRDAADKEIERRQRKP
jgi:hypothetical protein